MVETEPVETKIVVDDSDVQAKFDAYERRIKALESSAGNNGKRAGTSFFGGLFGSNAGSDAKANAAGKKASSAFMGGLVGGAIGFVAGAATQNDAVSAVLELLTNIIAAALLPVLVALLPLIVALTPVLIGIGEAVGKLLEWLTAETNKVTEALVSPLPDEERDRIAAERGGMAAPEGTVLKEPGGGTRTVDREETVRLPFPIPIPVNREKLWGPDIVG